MNIYNSLLITADWNYIDRPEQIDLDAARLCFQVIGTINGERKYLGNLVSSPIVFRTRTEVRIPVAAVQNHFVSELSLDSCEFDIHFILVEDFSFISF